MFSSALYGGEERDFVAVTYQEIVRLIIHAHRLERAVLHVAEYGELRDDGRMRLAQRGARGEFQ